MLTWHPAPCPGSARGNPARAAAPGRAPCAGGGGEGDVTPTPATAGCPPWGQLDHGSPRGCSSGSPRVGGSSGAVGAGVSWRDGGSGLQWVHPAGCWGGDTQAGLCPAQPLPSASPGGPALFLWILFRLRGAGSQHSRQINSPRRAPRQRLNKQPARDCESPVPPFPPPPPGLARAVGSVPHRVGVGAAGATRHMAVAAPRRAEPGPVAGGQADTPLRVPVSGLGVGWVSPLLPRGPVG